ncbi:hypothetical protein [Limimaricola sp.]
MIFAVIPAPVTSLVELRRQSAGVEAALALTEQRGPARIFLVMR